MRKKFKLKWHGVMALILCLSMVFPLTGYSEFNETSMSSENSATETSTRYTKCGKTNCTIFL